MKGRITAVLLAIVLSSCGIVTPPATPDGVAWGVPYTAQIVPNGSLAPFAAVTRGYHVRIENRYAENVFVIAHELAHVYTWHHKLNLSAWRGVPCGDGMEDRCNAAEAYADAVADAVLDADCALGDLGWPGAAPSGCRLPHPSEIHPLK